MAALPAPARVSMANKPANMLIICGYYRQPPTSRYKSSIVFGILAADFKKQEPPTMRTRDPVPSAPSISPETGGRESYVCGRIPQRSENVWFHYRIPNQFLKQFKIDHCALIKCWSDWVISMGRFNDKGMNGKAGALAFRQETRETNIGTVHVGTGFNVGS